MPIYDYQCRACGYVFDALQKLSDEPLSACPECGEAALQKLLSAPNFQLRGKGWRKPQAELKKTVKRGHMFDQAVPHAEHVRPSSDGGDHGGVDRGSPAEGARAAADHARRHPVEHSHDHGHDHSHGSGHSHSHGHSHGPGHSHEH